MRLGILIIHIILFVSCGFLHPQSVQDDELITNLSVYSKLLEKNLGALENQFVLIGKDKIFCVNINSGPGISEYLYLKIRQRLNSFRIISDLDSASSDFIVEFKNVKFLTKYDKIFGSLLKSRKVHRRIEVSYDCTIKRKIVDSVLYYRNINEFNEDDFYLDRVEDVERGGYDFTKGKLPEQSFFEKAFIPGIVTLTSAMAIVLFFIIRSK
jgi:hypothetical protein